MNVTELLEGVYNFIIVILTQFSEIQNIIIDLIVKLVYYIVLFSIHSFEVVILLEIIILSYCILKSKYYNQEHNVHGGFNKIITMFKVYININYNIICLIYRLFESIITMTFRVGSIIAEAIPH